MYIDISLPIPDKATIAQLGENGRTTQAVAPRFCTEKGLSIEGLEFGRLCGPCQVVVIPHKDMLITPAHLIKIPIHPGSRLLFKTAGSIRQTGERKKIMAEPVRFAMETAALLADRRVALVGIDEASIDDPQDDHSPVHRLLLSYEIAIIENLFLGHVNPGVYELLCLPLNFIGHSVAPCRAVLKEIDRM